MLGIFTVGWRTNGEKSFLYLELGSTKIRGEIITSHFDFLDN